MDLWVGRASHGQGRADCFRSFVWGLLFLCIVAAPLAASAVDDPGDGCQWIGPMNLVQTGTSFTGSMALNLVKGECPATLTGIVLGSVSGSGSGFSVNFGLASGELGSVEFGGTLSDDGQSGTGTWANEASGTWSAEKRAHGAPTLSGTALATLFGLLMAAGVLSARRRVRSAT
jgi:opacity protein-like surface antigen